MEREVLEKHYKIAVEALIEIASQPITEDDVNECVLIARKAVSEIDGVFFEDKKQNS